MFELEKCDPTFASTAKHRFVNRISTRLDPETVFDVVSGIIQVEKEWFPDFVSTTWQTAAPHGVASHREYKLRYMTIVEEFLVWTRGERLTFRVNQCSLPILDTFLEDYELERTPEGGTNLLWQACYKPRALLAPLHPLIRPFFAGDFRKATKGLERVFERLASGSPSPV